MDYARIGQIGGLRRSATTDMGVLAHAGQRSFRDSFENGHGCRVCTLVKIPDDITPEERKRRSNALYNAHFKALAYASMATRAKRNRAVA